LFVLLGSLYIFSFTRKSQPSEELLPVKTIQTVVRRLLDRRGPVCARTVANLHQSGDPGEHTATCLERFGRAHSRACPWARCKMELGTCRIAGLLPKQNFVCTQIRATSPLNRNVGGLPAGVAHAPKLGLSHLRMAGSLSDTSFEGAGHNVALVEHLTLVLIQPRIPLLWVVKVFCSARVRLAEVGADVVATC